LFKAFKLDLGGVSIVLHESTQQTTLTT